MGSVTAVAVVECSRIGAFCDPTWSAEQRGAAHAQEVRVSAATALAICSLDVTCFFGIFIFGDMRGNGVLACAGCSWLPVLSFLLFSRSSPLRATDQTFLRACGAAAFLFGKKSFAGIMRLPSEPHEAVGSFLGFIGGAAPHPCRVVDLYSAMHGDGDVRRQLPPVERHEQHGELNGVVVAAFSQVIREWRMQNERRCHGTFLPCTPQIFSIKHVIALFSVVWGITVMHRCCGTYDLWSLRVVVAAPNSASHLCVCVRVYVPTSSCRVCAVTAVPHGCGDRGEQYAWTNPPRAPRCCYCLLSPTLCWVNVTHLPSLWWSSCMWCASNTVWMTLLLRLSVMPVTFVSYSYSFFCLAVSVQL
ncbi:putative retrotransposon hot spot protein (RHS,) [Trypanosoma cruzi]|uniref:Putative retrotransposon hot spot protein (RHS,) n=1 Tax=Trypanosoma cruzi TaxID=5693 RepID=A0A2V2UMW2_TRYCR|nr:putative retrotransposon hot spot protein (RHS,) [Trypanosoma cruzi]